MEEEENFTIPASEVTMLCQEHVDFINLKDNSEIVLTEAMEATEWLNTVFNHIRTSMNRMSPRMKELFIVPVTKSSRKTIEPGNNQAHDKAAPKAATERRIVQIAIVVPVPGTGIDDRMRLKQSHVPVMETGAPCHLDDRIFKRIFHALLLGIPESIECSQHSIREPQSIDMNALREEIKETISATIKEKLCSEADSVTTVSQSMLALDANAQYWSDLSNKPARRGHRALELQLKLAVEKVNTLLHEEAPEEVLLEAAQEEQIFVPMAPKKRTVDKVPAGTGVATDSSSTPNVIGGNNPTMDPGQDPSKTTSAVSEVNTIRPTTRNTHATDELAHPASERGTFEDPTQTPNPHDGSGDPLLPKTYSDYAEPSERLASADPDPEELALGDQIQEMLDTINEHMDEVNSIHNMSCQAAQLLDKTNKSNSALEARTRSLRMWLITIREKYPAIAKGKVSLRPRDPHKDPYNEDIDPHPE
ncbi:hypothetical protein M422DRAFT_247672 [Sphaerobolus stellatus SS14]|nr:hypothetical protein M422DRAFT_247672 [Sphaerobolus stellatus SS14]